MKPYIIQNPSNGGKMTVFLTSLISVFAPIYMLAIIVLVFIFTDFVFGLIVSIKIRRIGFNSKQAWQTVWKIIGAEVCILLAFLLDKYVICFIPTIYLANVFAGFICGADLWSILTNFAILSNHPVFRLIKKWGKSEIENKIGIDVSELEE